MDLALSIVLLTVIISLWSIEFDSWFGQGRSFFDWADGYKLNRDRTFTKWVEKHPKKVICLGITIILLFYWAGAN